MDQRTAGYAKRMKGRIAALSQLSGRRRPFHGFNVSRKVLAGLSRKSDVYRWALGRLGAEVAIGAPDEGRLVTVSTVSG